MRPLWQTSQTPLVLCPSLLNMPVDPIEAAVTFLRKSVDKRSLTTSNLRDPKTPSIQLNGGHVNTLRSTGLVKDGYLQFPEKVSIEDKPATIDLRALAENKEFLSKPERVIELIDVLHSEMIQEGPTPLIHMLRDLQIEPIIIQGDLTDEQALIAYDAWIKDGKSLLGTPELRQEMADRTVGMIIDRRLDAEGTDWFLNHPNVDTVLTKLISEGAETYLKIPVQDVLKKINIKVNSILGPGLDGVRTPPSPRAVFIREMMPPVNPVSV